MEFQGLAQGPHCTLRNKASVVVLIMGSAVGFSAPGFASQDSYKMPQELCDILREEPVNPSLLKQLARRPDVLDLLHYAEENCSGVAGLLIGATGAIPVLVAERDGAIPRPVPGPGTGSGGAPDNGGGDTGGGDTGGGDTGGGNTGGGDAGTGGSGGGTGTGGSGSGGSGNGGSGAGDSNGHDSGDSSSDSSDGSNDDDDSGNGSSSSDSHTSGY
jgi:hypothetical protein